MSDNNTDHIPFFEPLNNASITTGFAKLMRDASVVLEEPMLHFPLHLVRHFNCRNFQMTHPFRETSRAQRFSSPASVRHLLLHSSREMKHDTASRSSGRVELVFDYESDRKYTDCRSAITN